MATLAPDLEVAVDEVRLRLVAAQTAIEMGLDGQTTLSQAIENAVKLLAVASHWQHYGTAPSASDG
jgi:hypothetical protein